MSSFDAEVPEINPAVLDVAYGHALALVNSSIKTWRDMKTPQEVLDLVGTTEKEDLFFYQGGCVALEALKMELDAKRSTIFLS